ncbi:MAG: DUF6431 domain-containing protein [Verrucomicrobiales bacterium]
MEPPVCCPNCKSTRRLRFHGYYERDSSSSETGNLIRIKVRRYRCRDCHLTTSLLPSFCLPYRLVSVTTISRFLSSGVIHSTELKWQGLVFRCEKRFVSWKIELAAEIAAKLPFSLPGISNRSDWIYIEQFLGGIECAASQLLADCAVTLFGRYRCHSPGSKLPKVGGDHTTSMFPCGKDPPSCRIR